MTTKTDRHKLTTIENEQIGTALRQYRLGAGLSQEDLVTLMGEKPSGTPFASSTVSYIERGQFPMSRLFHDMLCDATNRYDWLPDGLSRDDLHPGLPNAGHKQMPEGYQPNPAETHRYFGRAGSPLPDPLEPGELPEPPEQTIKFQTVQLPAPAVVTIYVQHDPDGIDRLYTADPAIGLELVHLYPIHDRRDNGN